MTNCIFYSIFFVMFLNLSFGSLRLSQVNRAFMSSFKGMFEASVITVGDDGNPTHPYYSQPILNKYINEYLEENIKKYVTNYTLNIDYFTDESAAPCQINDKATKVKINLKAKINYLFDYDKTQSFEIDERSKL